MSCLECSLLKQSALPSHYQMPLESTKTKDDEVIRFNAGKKFEYVKSLGHSGGRMHIYFAGPIEARIALRSSNPWKLI